MYQSEVLADLSFVVIDNHRDVARSGRASAVVDEIVSVDPWHVRGVEVRGRAEALHGDRPLIRIHPERIVAWGLDGQEVESRSARASQGA